MPGESTQSRNPVPAKRSVGRPPARIDPEEIERCAALGMTQDQIADGLGISARTLRERKSQDQAILAAYKRGRFLAQQRVLGRLDKLAESWGPAAIFQAKNIAGWSDHRTVESHVTHHLTPAQQLAKERQPQQIDDAIEAEWEEVSSEG